MKTLTKAEESIMQVLWRLEKGFVRDIIDELPNPKPKYSTVSTIVRILEDKGFLDHKAYGKSHQYHPLVSRQAYAQVTVSRMLKDYFGGSFKSLVHFFSEYQALDLSEVNEIIAMLEAIPRRKND